MRLVALDTTTRAGSVAIVKGDSVAAECLIDPGRSYAEQLPGMLLNLLHSEGLALSAIDVFAVAAGPGSFTGVRIGIATIQGLAVVTGRRIVAVSALEALAHTGSDGLPPGATVGVWMDARRRDVFSALYRLEDVRPLAVGRLIELEPPSIGNPAATLDRWTARFGQPVRLVGDGATMYAAIVGASTQIRPAPPLAGTIGRIAAGRARAGQAIDPAVVQPLYVRRPDAEIARDLAERASRVSNA